MIEQIPAKSPARLVIPVWGEDYVGRVLSVTLPAILAPGNLPALCAMLAVEMAIVTESRLFDLVRGSRAFQSVSALCPVRLVPLDDLLSDIQSDYGMVLTYALFRGFADLGEQMIETQLIFLNADFIISDGSLGHLGKLMCDGHRLIQAPSFRVSYEEILPHLQASIDPDSGVLSLSSRAMARVALATKHPTVKARTVNQRLFHLVWMDQYYWYVDDETMIGYQSPMAMISVRPERAVTEPRTFWDYGFIPEAAPNLIPTFVTDSDDFLMIEPQSCKTGREMKRVGWLSVEKLAESQSRLSTKEHRQSSQQLFKIHCNDVPADIDEFIAESRGFVNEVYRHVSVSPVSHVAHPILGRWFEEATQRQRGEPTEEQNNQGRAMPKRPVPGSDTSSVYGVASIVKKIYRGIFGSLPRASAFHPLWVANEPLSSRILALQHRGQNNILWIGPADSIFSRLLGTRLDPGAVLAPHIRVKVSRNAPYDACVFQLTLRELGDLDELYANIRPLMAEGGKIIVSVVKDRGVLEDAEAYLKCLDYPATDISEIHFNGTAATALVRASYLRSFRIFEDRRLARSLIRGATLLLLAPFARIANALAARRDTTVLNRAWTHLLLEFTVVRGAG